MTNTNQPTSTAGAGLVTAAALASAAASTEKKQDGKFVSFLKHIGRDIEHGLAKAAPVVAKLADVLANIYPGAGGLIRLVGGIIVSTEQKFAVQGKADGSGPIMLSEVDTIVGGAVQDYFTQRGNPVDAETAKKWAGTIATLLNLIPATAATDTTGAAPHIEAAVTSTH